MALPIILVLLTAVLVAAAGWKLSDPQNSTAGAVSALLLFLFHPGLRTAIITSSPWDAIFVMLFVAAWLWMEHWSLFMRSWVLAGIYAFGLWIGSPLVLWGLFAMVPWVLFNRRPLMAVGSMLNVLLGGLAIFAVTWGGAWLFTPSIGRPIFAQWIRWGGLQVPPSVSLPWVLLAAGAVLEHFQEMITQRRADASVFAAMLLVATALFASPSVNLALIALSSPLIAETLAKREFLYLRRVRWIAAAAFVMASTFAYAFKYEAWMASGVAMLLTGIAARLIYRRSWLSQFQLGEAVCVGAYLAETFHHLMIASLPWTVCLSLPVVMR
jgi:hypothetical protein